MVMRQLYVVETRTSSNEPMHRVREFPIFSGVRSTDCTDIVSIARERRFQRGEKIFFQGAPVEQTVLLLSGCVKETQSSHNGGEVIVRLHGAGEIVGPLGLCAKEHRSTAQGIQPSKALIWDRTTFKMLSDRFPALRSNMSRILGERLEELEERFREISTEKVASRVSSQLIRLATQVGHERDGGIQISLSRQELAQLTGTTLFSVSRLLSEWQRQGLVTARRETVLLRKFSALQHVSES
jgi:CRP/FNR family transcriptional regulator, nitrogen oxide reductase regulator